MTRIKAHNPAKQVTGGDSSRSLPAGGGGVATNVPLYLYRASETTTETQHEMTLDKPAEKFCEMNGFVSATVNYTVRPWLKFGTTVIDFSQTSRFSSAAAFCDHQGTGLADSGNNYITNHKLGFTYANRHSYDVTSSTTLQLKMRLTKRSDNFWEVWQESLFLSDSIAPRRMDAKYQIDTAGLGDLTGIGVACYDFTGSTLIGSSYGLSVESM